jgi:hypothetical protein
MFEKQKHSREEDGDLDFTIDGIKLCFYFIHFFEDDTLKKINAVQSFCNIIVYFIYFILCLAKLEEIGKEINEEILKIQQKYAPKQNQIYKERAVILKSIPEFWGLFFNKLFNS